MSRPRWANSEDLLRLRSLTREQFGDLLVVGVAGDCEGVCGERGLHLGVVEVDDGAVVLDHVHLFDARDRVHRELLQRRLQALVVRRRRPVNNLLKVIES